VIEPRGERIAPGIGYLLVPGFAGGRPEDQVDFAQSLQDAIRAVAASCGWIVDLRRNSGGNLWPMLLGVGPLIGDGDAGAAVYADGRRIPFWYREGSVGLGDYAQLRVTRPYRLGRKDPYVAVLLGERTASSGEILAGAFGGSPRRRSFGAATSGLATGNKNFSLPDGATLVLTVSATSDRTGAVVIGPLAPDQAVPERSAVEAASRWLGAQCAFAAEGAGNARPPRPPQPQPPPGSPEPPQPIQPLTPRSR
jgi:C-terminal processing protease CtpA/Prc